MVQINITLNPESIQVFLSDRWGEAVKNHKNQVNRDFKSRICWATESSAV